MGTCRGEEESNEKLLKSVSCESFHLLRCVVLASVASVWPSGCEGLHKSGIKQ